jgi:hypothetical protein
MLSRKYYGLNAKLEIILEYVLYIFLFLWINIMVLILMIIYNNLISIV